MFVLKNIKSFAEKKHITCKELNDKKKTEIWNPLQELHFDFVINDKGNGRCVTSFMNCVTISYWSKIFHTHFNGVEPCKSNWNNHVNQVFPIKKKTEVQIAISNYTTKTGEVAAEY